jgi:hypothetical protein
MPFSVFSASLCYFTFLLSILLLLLHVTSLSSYLHSRFLSLSQPLFHISLQMTSAVIFSYLYTAANIVQPHTVRIAASWVICLQGTPKKKSSGAASKSSPEKTPTAVTPRNVAAVSAALAAGVPAGEAASSIC